jgi:hypothetical protein
MPTSAFPFLALFISMFAFFIVVVGGVSLWCEWGTKSDDQG